jgi:ParB-like chromosome segregation protein Spo0J
MNVETVDITTLHEDPANLRRHPERNLDAIKASLTRFGQQKPIVVDSKNLVRAGNGTLAAARALGWKTIGVVRSELIGSEATAFAIADNRTAELGVWDEEALAETVRSLDSEGIDIGALGFDETDLDALMGEFGAAELPEPPSSVEENVDDLEEIKRQRKEGNQQTADKNDTERYLVIVFDDREGREKCLEKLGLPSDERYVAASAVEIRKRSFAGGATVGAGGRNLSAAPASKSGAGG